MTGADLLKLSMLRGVEEKKYLGRTIDGTKTGLFNWLQIGQNLKMKIYCNNSDI